MHQSSSSSRMRVIYHNCTNDAPKLNVIIRGLLVAIVIKRLIGRSLSLVCVCTSIYFSDFCHKMQVTVRYTHPSLVFTLRTIIHPISSSSNNSRLATTSKNANWYTESTCLHAIWRLLTVYGHIKTAQQRTIIQQYGDWYTGGRWWVGC